MEPELRDRQVRVRAFEFLAHQTQLLGDVLPWSVLSRGFEFDGQRVPLIGPQGIFKPAVLADIPLTIATAPVVDDRPRPYEDGLDDVGHLLYRYRGTDPKHRDNVGLRRAMERHVPLIYLFGVVKGEYLPAWPVYVVGDDPASLCFRVAVDDTQSLQASGEAPTAVAEARRSYVTVVTLRRLHQATFRQRVLQAYSTAAPSAGSSMPSCWRPPTSCRTATLGESPSSPTGSRCARCITPPSIGTSSGSGRTSSSRCARISSRRQTARCSAMAFRRYRGPGS